MRGEFRAAPDFPTLVVTAEYWMLALLSGLGADAVSGGHDVGRATGTRSGGCGAEPHIDAAPGELPDDLPGDLLASEPFPLVGRVCTVLPGGAGTHDGWAEATTDDGSPALLAVRTPPGDPAVPAGRTALLHAHDPATDTFLITPLDLSALFS
ncbi:hypothetical protein ABTX81_24875 [Kitasatospora sp. NPDC097605]|uniref:hypothetical protein n=1 Tax=Kitasatospora sp. NPDC097605 TaxID=3157226 RepID=UPI00332BAD3B